jgi:integrase/recombinase XerD
MTINVTPRPTRNGQKIFYTFEWGKEVGQRQATGIFTYAKAKDQLQRNHNKEALCINILVNPDRDFLFGQEPAGRGR